MIKFYSKSKTHKVLSNFYVSPFEMDGLTFVSGEHAFHYKKFKSVAAMYKTAKTKDTGPTSHNSDTQSSAPRKRKADSLSEPVNAKKFDDYALKFASKSKFSSPLQAKRGGGKRGCMLLPEEQARWQKVCQKAQEQICWSRLKSDKELAATLLETEPKYLLHQENRGRNPIWGGRVQRDYDGPLDASAPIVGQNLLGKIWMKVRAKLKATTDKRKVTTALDTKT